VTGYRRRVRRALLLLAVVGVAAACGGAAKPQLFRNPIWTHNFRDPFVVRLGGTYYAYGTKDAQSTRSGITRNVYPANIQVLSSQDLVHWTREKQDALPRVPSWAYPQLTWAPEVLDAGHGRYVLYYTALAKNEGKQCIGMATGSSPTGPFADTSAKPFVCQTKEGGSIDPDPFRAGDGRLYLVWKSDGNSVGLPTWLYAQRLSGDGRRLLGKPARLVRNDAPWEGSVVEAPSMWREHGRIYLFFSANDFQSDLYAVGYARCRTPLGPCRDAAANPILKSRCEASGTGHQSIVRDANGRTWIAYHAFYAHPRPRQIDITVVWLDRLLWRRGRPVVHGPTCRAQPAP
jgi:beta-xylosidase